MYNLKLLWISLDGGKDSYLEEIIIYNVVEFVFGGVCFSWLDE